MIHVQTTSTVPNIYRSYLVRFWQSNEQGNWRASAQCVQTAQVMMFGDIPSLLAFLQREVEGGPAKEDATGPQEAHVRTPPKGYLSSEGETYTTI